MFTDQDIESATDSLSETPVSVTITSDVQQGLSSSASAMLVGSADIVLSANCPTVQFLCVRLATGPGASFIDNDDSDDSNSKCIDITNRKQCLTGLSVIKC